MVKRVYVSDSNIYYGSFQFEILVPSKKKKNVVDTIKVLTMTKTKLLPSNVVRSYGVLNNGNTLRSI